MVVRQRHKISIRHDCIRFRFETINVSGPLTLTDQPLMVDAAIDGIGIAFVPDHLAVEALDKGYLERVLDNWCPPFPGLCL